MLTAFVLAAMLATPTEEPTIAQIQEQMEAYLQDFKHKLAYAHKTFEGENEFENDLRRPDTGMAVKSMPTPDAQGLHPLEVLAVFPGEPADEAGIKPDDRITFIGPRRIEHETTDVVLMILEKAPNPLSLTILRGTSELKVVVVQRPLHCMERALAQFDRTKWLRLVEARQLQITHLQDALKRYPNDIALLRETNRELQEINMLTPMLLEKMYRDLESFAFNTCNPDAPPDTPKEE